MRKRTTVAEHPKIAFQMHRATLQLSNKWLIDFLPARHIGHALITTTRRHLKLSMVRIPKSVDHPKAITFRGAFILHQLWPNLGESSFASIVIDTKKEATENKSSTAAIHILLYFPFAGMKLLAIQLRKDQSRPSSTPFKFHLKIVPHTT